MRSKLEHTAGQIHSIRHNLVTLTLICAGIVPVADAGPLAYVVTDSKQFGAIDLATGAYSPIGATPDVLIGIGISNRTIYGVDTLDRLIAIDPQNALTTVIGPTGMTGSGPNSSLGAVSVFASLTTGGLFAFDWSSNLYSINPASGAATLIGSTGIPALSGPFGSIAAAGDASALYYIIEEISDPRGQTTVIPGSVYRIDPATGHAVLLTTALPTLPFLGAGFAGGSLYAFRGSLGPLPPSQIWQLDPSSGTVLSVFNQDPAAGNVYSAVSSPVPEPGTLFVVAVALLASCIARRRKR